MWVQLQTVHQIDRNGVMMSFYPGDWVDVGKQTALLWISRGEAKIGNRIAPKTFVGRAGVVIVGDREVVIPDHDSLEIAHVTELSTPFELNLIWDGSVMLRPELINVGFSFLSTWETACPLFSYTQLAVHLGTSADRERTKLIIRDLRVPVYDPRMIFLRRCEASDRLLESWRREREDSTNDQLAFMRAFYKVKPLMLSLPITWTGGKVD